MKTEMVEPEQRIVKNKQLLPQIASEIKFYENRIGQSQQSVKRCHHSLLTLENLFLMRWIFSFLDTYPLLLANFALTEEKYDESRNSSSDLE